MAVRGLSASTVLAAAVVTSCFIFKYFLIWGLPHHNGCIKITVTARFEYRVYCWEAFNYNWRLTCAKQQLASFNLLIYVDEDENFANAQEKHSMRLASRAEPSYVLFGFRLPMVRANSILNRNSGNKILIPQRRFLLALWMLESCLHGSFFLNQDLWIRTSSRRMIFYIFLFFIQSKWSVNI